RLVTCRTSGPCRPNLRPGCMLSPCCRPPDPPSVPTRRSSDLERHVGRVCPDFGGEPAVRSIDGLSVPGDQTIDAADSRLASEIRSEEHTSELQSLAYLVCRLLLEKKKKMKLSCLIATSG